MTTITIDLNEVLGADAEYVNSDSADSLSGLPATAWDALVEAAVELNGEGSVPGLDCAVAKTGETLAEFDASRAEHWTEPGLRREHSFAGHAAVGYERLQMFKGQPRVTMIVVDCGEYRAALSV